MIGLVLLFGLVVTLRIAFAISDDEISSVCEQLSGRVSSKSAVLHPRQFRLEALRHVMSPSVHQLTNDVY